MRTLAIGDIHGCLRAFDSLLDAVQPAPEDLMITLGDYVDRGPQSRQVIERLIGLAATHRLVPLLGNHDEMMLESRLSDDDCRYWRMCGGEATLRSYGPGLQPHLAMDRVPQSHWDFLVRCKDWHETATHIFVHGYVDPALSMQQQEPGILRWARFDDPQPHISGKTIICGHTAQREGLPVSVGHAICIDTNAYAGAWLTCLDVGSGRYWQANQKGQMRMGRLGTADC